MLFDKKVRELRRLYQLRITLIGSHPPIWRSLEMTSDASLGKLHQVILAAMGWSGRHQHRFSAGGRYYGVPEPDHNGVMHSEQEVRLSHVAPREGRRFIYEYDPGDNWRHEILVSSISALGQNPRHPVCTGGERACPPENIGGIFRYFDFLEALKDGKHPAHNVMRQWVGKDFDPDNFDMEAANARLSKIV